MRQGKGIMSRVCCLWALLLLLLLVAATPSLAQKRGPITIYVVNDSQEPLTAVWLNQLRVVGDELIPATTGPILPGGIEKYKSFPYDGIEFHNAGDDCGTKKGTHYSPQGECKSTMVRVKKTDGDYPTNIVIMAPNFQATSEAVLNPTFLVRAMRSGTSIDANISILNVSGKKTNLFWVNPTDKSLVAMADEPIESREEPHFFKSSIYHQFVLKEHGCRNKKEEEPCGLRYFRVTGKEIEVIVPADYNYVEVKQLPYDPLARFTYKPGIDLFQQCHDHVRPELHFEKPGTIIKEIDRCIRTHWDQVNWGFDAKQQTYLDFKMENYVCDENRMETTAPVEIELWRNDNDRQTRTVFVLHHTDSSQIHLISNFVSPEECRALEEAQGDWEQTKTKSSGGQMRPNQIRKASIARVDVPWKNPNDLVTKTGRRVFDYVNHIHPTLEISHEGQEPIQAIRYQGRGRDEPYPDQYKSHCDSDCNGQEVSEGQRVATVVMYCETPKEGGHTNFRNAHVHVKPQVGNAIFFSYVDVATRRHDTGNTIHAGCPVYEGTKKIFTQWVRYGVDYENPYTDYPLLPN